MGVYIKGKKMPKDCKACFLGLYDRQAYCRNGEKALCPLIEVKAPHGRLIDADAEYKALSEMKVEGEVFVTAVEFVKIEMEQVQTVIEAEEGE